MTHYDTLRIVNVGCRTASATDDVQGASVPLWFLYPTRSAAQARRFGPYPLDVATDAPIEGEHLPLAVISHGTGGSPWVYRDLAAHLARAGFVVALIEHPGNNRRDDRLSGTAANLANRPRHVRLCLDAAFADAAVGPHLSPDGVALIGHSMGGYTALAVAGGRPTSMPHESPDDLAHRVDVTPDPRVRALVLFAPALVWFCAEDDALSDVDVPVLLFTAGDDELAPGLNSEVVLRGVRDPQRVEHRVVEGGGHYAFLSPFPAAMCDPSFAPSQDPPGFDRAAFHRVMNAEVVTFLRRAR